jgi:hypothetical protein
MVPQFLLCASQVVGVQPHLFATPAPPHVSGKLHVLQTNVSLQPSEMLPHSAPCAAHVVGVQEPEPHLKLPPAPQVWPLPQSPQFSVFPQPSGGWPQSAPRDAQVAGVQTHLPPWQARGASHPPQSRVFPQPSDAVPH